jgi:formylglycine-generating enzyme required for sulfatase activity/class 3 adenylate cyclase
MQGEVSPVPYSKNTTPPGRAALRRLAAVVAGDIADYSQLIGVKGDAALARLTQIQRELVEPTIAEHYGRIVKTTDGGFIAIFDSPVEAVRCAIVIQQNMIGRNASVPEQHSIVYRIGINLGDVVVEPTDVYGDGVEIAVRLEGIATPGEVCISGGVYEQIKNKLVCGYQSLGNRQVKSITDPVTVYRVLPDPAAIVDARHPREVVLIVALGAALLTVSVGALWQLVMQQSVRVRGGAPASVQVPVGISKPSPQPSPIERTATTPKPAKEPEMVRISPGLFAMGSSEDISERPIHRVSTRPFAIGKFPITVREWNQCVAAKACTDLAVGGDDVAVTNVSWTDAKQFVVWLAQATHKNYRMPSEAEWEYAARGGTQTKYWWGDDLLSGMANCRNCNDTSASEQLMKVGSFKPNQFGLYDMGGSVDQWVEDCWHKNYHGAPLDGSPWIDGDCASHVIRSGSWKNDASYVRPANRDHYDAGVRYPTHGFRVALSP